MGLSSVLTFGHPSPVEVDILSERGTHSSATLMLSETLSGHQLMGLSLRVLQILVWYRNGMFADPVLLFSRFLRIKVLVFPCLGTPMEITL